MTEKKRPIKPGQVNLSEYDPELLGPEPTPTSDGKTILGVPPSFSLEKLASYLASYLAKDSAQLNIRLPKELIEKFYQRCEEKGYHRRANTVIALLMAGWVGGAIQVPELSNQGKKVSFRQQLEEQEIRAILEELDNSKRQGIKNPIYLRDKLAKVAKRIKLIPELEEQVRKELNL